ncbi:neprosin family prolyl endopeptidase [Kitasatospora sp. NBC_01287]|uniref:neprosin family prolyl endopeptidase n=1 Tax=Kitasatospora sp. NBC_01287 TaxID=2903573 RepID=UPI002256E522|nr:neprosin family prolyl endopeptidase [Kitasatospora sp. NBC_01287]MCX4747280.1 neprosin family prolyl endopeptidase [Kitasatospora sp. NBC_01287]
MRIRQALVSGATTLAAALSLLAAAPAANATPVTAAATTPATAAPSPGPLSPPLVNGSGPVCWFGSCYDYVSGRQVTDTDGATVRMLQAAPAIKPGDTDSHSLQELALQSSDQKSTVEIGWTVDLGLNGDVLPHLFVYHWVDGATSCYNGCGFVQVSRTAKAGMALRPGTPARFSIQNVAGDWWLFYNEQAVGYFPGSLWNGTYTRAQVVTAFGEVAHATGSTCEQMGDGRPGTARSAGWISDFHLLGATDRSSLTVAATSPALYSAGAVTPTSFRLGGPGTGPC